MAPASSNGGSGQIQADPKKLREAAAAFKWAQETIQSLKSNFAAKPPEHLDVLPAGFPAGVVGNGWASAGFFAQIQELFDQTLKQLDKQQKLYEGLQHNLETSAKDYETADQTAATDFEGKL